MGKEKVRQRVALGSDKTSAKKKTVSKSPKETEEEKKKREEEEDEEFEKQCEKYCSYVITLAMIASPLYGLVTFVGEYVTRSPMVADVADLSQQKIVITGGCDGMGAELARMMVDSGGSVTLGCRDMDRAEDAVRQIQLGSKDPAAARSAVVARQLDLESFESVREFATQYNDENDRLDVLILNAGTTVGCNMTVDDQEMAFQVNYLGHYLLSDLLLPKIKGSSRNLAERETGRIVSVTCPAAKDGAIVLENIPPIVEDFETCSPSKEYANSKVRTAAEHLLPT
jgi:NAD(P)-dependent dehydrogenase (short-subunit alcohol dehydrogenase family)